MNLQKTKMSIYETLNLELCNAFMGKLKSAKQCFWIILLLLFCCNLILTSYHTFYFLTTIYIYLYITAELQKGLEIVELRVLKG